MQISVVVPTHNRCALLKNALTSLQSQECVGTMEIVVVVDGCTDATLEMIKSDFPNVQTVVFEENVGAAIGLNAGAARATGEILLFLDDDMQYRPGLVVAHQNMHSQSEYDVLIGHFPLGNLPHSSFFRNAISEWTEDWQKHFPDDVSFYDALCSGHFSIKRDLFNAVSGFDQNFSVWGRKDSELGYRLIESGACFGFCRDAEAVQDYEKLPSQFLGDFELLGKADVDLVSKHTASRDSLLLSSYHQAPWFVRWLRQHCAENSIRSAQILEIASSMLDILHTISVDHEVLESLLWLCADVAYWKGVRDKWDTSEFSERIGGSTAILMYHRIADDGCGFSVTRENFEMQMRYLHDNGYTVLSLQEVISAIEHKTVLPEKTVVITFDDGYVDFLEAWAVIQSFQFPATLFLPTAYIGRTNSWDTKSMDNTYPILEETQLRSLVSEGLDLQAHSHTHPYFTKINPEAIRQEVVQCSDALNDFGVDAKFFAFPSGEYTPIAANILRELGYRAGLSCVSTLASRDSNLMCLPRITVENGDLTDFAMRLQFGIGVKHAATELWDQMKTFRPAKYWHTAPDFDPDRIYYYQSKRPKGGLQ